MGALLNFVPADVLLQHLGQPPLFHAVNPFEWMDLISLQGKTNFFEKRVGEYAKAGVMSSEKGEHTREISGCFNSMDDDF